MTVSLEFLLVGSSCWFALSAAFVRRFSTSVVAACVVVDLGHFSPEVEIELSLVRWEKVGS